jgi:hypothetical protein
MQIILSRKFYSTVGNKFWNNKHHYILQHTIQLTFIKTMNILKKKEIK